MSGVIEREYISISHLHDNFIMVPLLVKPRKNEENNELIGIDHTFPSTVEALNVNAISVSPKATKERNSTLHCKEGQEMAGIPYNSEEEISIFRGGRSKESLAQKHFGPSGSRFIQSSSLSKSGKDIFGAIYKRASLTVSNTDDWSETNSKTRLKAHYLRMGHMIECVKDDKRQSLSDSR
ncbi:hypothetical protein Tco_0299754 [Tanacetum coccineum]